VSDTPYLRWVGFKGSCFALLCYSHDTAQRSHTALVTFTITAPTHSFTSLAQPLPLQCTLHCKRSPHWYSLLPLALTARTHCPHSLHLRYNQALLLLHLVWVLPAVLITWNLDWTGNRPLRLALATVGLRFGLDLTLMDDDTRISPWAVDGNGMIWDLILFVLTYLHRRLLLSDLNTNAIAVFEEQTFAAQGRLSQFVADRRAENAERLRVRDKQLGDIRDQLAAIHRRQEAAGKRGGAAMDADTRDHVYNMDLSSLMATPQFSLPATHTGSSSNTITTSPEATPQQDSFAAAAAATKPTMDPVELSTGEDSVAQVSSDVEGAAVAPEISGPDADVKVTEDGEIVCVCGGVGGGV
jgi:hypothetical protein